MKTKIITKISAFLLVAIFCFFAFAGCAAQMDLPNKNDAVTGNGGLVVQKGQYLYFVNGYTSAENIKKADEVKGVEYSAIYRTKLGENNEIIYNEDGTLQNCEKIIDKVCGFEKTALYIFDDYIYYQVPNTSKVKNEEKLEYNFKLTDFYRAKLDGSGQTWLYKTKNASDDTKFVFYKTNNSKDVFLSLYDGKDLISVNCSTKEAKTICEGVSSVAMPIYSVYNQDNNQLSKGASNVYYTRSGNDDENLTAGNVLCYYTLGENQEHIIASGYNTYTAVYATNEALVFTKKSNYDLSAFNYVIKYDYDADGNLNLDVQNGNKAIQLDASEHKSIWLCTFEEGNQAGIITKNETGKLVYINYQTNKYEVLNTERTLTPLFVAGTKVYAYSESNWIYQIDYKTKAEKLLCQKQGENDDINEPYFEAKKNFSVCGGYVYYFAKYEGDSETGYYLNRVSAADRETYTVESVAKVLVKHIKTKTEEK